jgi:pyruvate dehydrogenase E2 component (dihydrolipoamide acetyltransferase)
MPEIQMPKLSDTMTEGTLVAWKKKKGDKVTAGEVLAEIETDKATMEWESPEDGTLTEIFVEEGGKVEVGQKIAFIGEPEEKKKPAETEQPAPAQAKKEETAPAQPSPEGRASARPQSKQPAPREDKPDDARIKASPVAKRLAGELGVDLNQLQGTGPKGRITESDVRAAAKSATVPVAAVADRGSAPPPKTSAPAPSPTLAPGTRIQLSGMRRGVAERLVQSKGPVPHFYLNIDIDAGPLLTARAELKAAGEESDTSKITVNDFILKAAVMAAVKVPKVNASFDGDALVQFADVDLGVAVAIPDGLLTPVIRGAQNKSLPQISAEAKELASRARNKRMKPEEFQGGSFTVSNLGGMGIDSFSAIINPPQGFILAVGAIRKVPVIDNCDAIVAGHRMSIWMSCDHRVIDGALGAEYLKELRQLLENPALLLV